MIKTFQTFLLGLKKKKGTLQELEQLSVSLTYAQFAELILALEAQGVILQIKAHGTNGENPVLGLGYHI